MVFEALALGLARTYPVQSLKCGLQANALIGRRPLFSY